MNRGFAQKNHPDFIVAIAFLCPQMWVCINKPAVLFWVKNPLFNPLFTHILIKYILYCMVKYNSKISIFIIHMPYATQFRILSPFRHRPVHTGEACVCNQTERVRGHTRNIQSLRPVSSHHNPGRYVARDFPDHTILSASTSRSCYR